MRRKSDALPLLKRVGGSLYAGVYLRVRRTAAGRCCSPVWWWTTASPRGCTRSPWKRNTWTHSRPLLRKKGRKVERVWENVKDADAQAPAKMFDFTGPHRGGDEIGPPWSLNSHDWSRTGKTKSKTCMIGLKNMSDFYPHVWLDISALLYNRASQSLSALLCWYTLWRDRRNLWNLVYFDESDQCEITGLALQMRVSLLNTLGVLRLYLYLLFPESHYCAYLHRVYMTARVQSEHQRRDEQKEHQKIHRGTQLFLVTVSSASVTNLEANIFFYWDFFFFLD